MSLEERMEGLKKPRETKFGDSEIVNDEQALDILHELEKNTTNVGAGWEKVHHAIKYLDRRLQAKVEDPEKKAE